MKLPVLSNNLSRPSYRQRIGDFVSYLDAAGIETEVFQLPKGKFRRWSLLKSSRDYDGVLLHKKCLNRMDAVILRRYSKKIIYDFDDAIMYSPHRPDSDRTSHMRLFRRTVSMVDCVIAGNAYLAEHARRFCSNVHVLPTGLNVKPYTGAKTGNEDGHIRLVWIGSASTLKYLAELKPLLEEIGGQDNNLVLRIIGDEFIDAENISVEKCRWSLDRQAADLKACDIGLAPLPDDRFTRGKCGFKILQYFAADLPVIASPVGVNCDLIEQSRAGLLASTRVQWKESIGKLMKPETRSEMAKNANQFIRQYDTEVLAEKFCEIIRSMTQ